MLDWAFRNRKTGKITIAQLPNVSLGLFLLGTVARLVLQPSGRVGTGFTVVTTGALTWWAVDELFRGVNPWRRFMGASALVWEVVRLAGR